MKPVRTNRSNFVYRGPTIDIADAWCERAVVSAGPGRRTSAVYIDWQPTQEERDAIAVGKGVIRLGIFGMEPIPPVSIEVRPDIEVVDEKPPPIQEASPFA